MQNLWSGIFINIFCSIFASTVYLIIIFVLLRPRIEISKAIAFDDVFYFFKVCNKSFFRAYDIKIELYEVTSIHDHGKHLQLKNIDINKSVSSAPSLAKFNIISRFSHPQTHAIYEFALQFKTSSDIKNVLTDSQKFIRVQVEARHGLTGLQSIFIQDFDNMSVIKHGSFISGKSFEIK